MRVIASTRSKSVEAPGYGSQAQEELAEVSKAGVWLAMAFLHFADATGF